MVIECSVKYEMLGRALLGAYLIPARTLSGVGRRKEDPYRGRSAPRIRQQTAFWRMKRHAVQGGGPDPLLVRPLFLPELCDMFAPSAMLHEINLLESLALSGATNTLLVGNSFY